MAIRNNVTLVGNIGREPKITEVREGAKVARFDMATHHTVLNKKGESVQRTEWHKVFAWGNQAQFIELKCEKGSPICIHGRLVNRTYLSKDGQPRKYTEIEVKQVIKVRD